MNDEAKPADKFADLSEDTRRFIAGLDEDDIHTLNKGLEIIRLSLAFGKVTKWLIVSALALFFGVVMLWEAVIKFVGFIKGA
jgi:hypothetical protein